MDEFVVIRVMNEAMLRLKKSKNEDYTVNQEIKEALKDEALFFKVKKDIALKILISIGVSNERLEVTYQKLITKSMHDRLIQTGKIKATDNLIIKYN